MRADAHQKIKPTHLNRTAYLYIRQSTLRQVFENVESTKRQYALRQHAVALGWQQSRIVVIDTDLGQSGSATDREGFQHLVTEVSLGEPECWHDYSASDSVQTVRAGNTGRSIK